MSCQRMRVDELTESVSSPDELPILPQLQHICGAESGRCGLCYPTAADI